MESAWQNPDGAEEAPTSRTALTAGLIGMVALVLMALGFLVNDSDAEGGVLDFLHGLCILAVPLCALIALVTQGRVNAAHRRDLEAGNAPGENFDDPLCEQHFRELIEAHAECGNLDALLDIAGDVTESSSRRAEALFATVQVHPGEGHRAWRDWQPDPLATPVLLRCLGNGESEGLRKSAAWILSLTADRAAIPALISLLEDSSRKVRRDSIKALGRLKARKAVDPLLASAAKNDREGRAASAALVEIRDERALAPLRLLAETHPRRRERRRLAAAVVKLEEALGYVPSRK